MLLLHENPLSGKKTYWRPLDDKGAFELVTVHDVEPHLEHNKALAGVELNKKSEMWHAASIPASLVLKWRVEEGIDVYDDNDWPAVKRKLNSNEYRYLRTKEFII